MNQEHHGASWMMLIYFLNFKMRQAKVGMNINLLLLYLLISLSILCPQANCPPVVTLFPCCLSMTLPLLYQVQQWFHQKLFVQALSGEFMTAHREVKGQPNMIGCVGLPSFLLLSKAFWCACGWSKSPFLLELAATTGKKRWQSDFISKRKIFSLWSSGDQELSPKREHISENIS